MRVAVMALCAMLLWPRAAFPSTNCLVCSNDTGDCPTIW